MKTEKDQNVTAEGLEANFMTKLQQKKAEIAATKAVEPEAVEPQETQAADPAPVEDAPNGDEIANEIENEEVVVEEGRQISTRLADILKELLDASATFTALPFNAKKVMEAAETIKKGEKKIKREYRRMNEILAQIKFEMEYLDTFSASMGYTQEETEAETDAETDAEPEAANADSAE